MGAVCFSIDRRLVRELTSVLPLTVFVETGTYEGAAVRTALSFFDHIHTIEVSKKLHDRAAKAFKDAPEVNLHLGSSLAVLRNLAPGLQDKGVLYWLDAHWCGGSDAEKGEGQCPLLEEIDAIGTLNDRSVLLIDDARLFLAPPPAPARPDDWPDLNSVLEALSTLSSAHEIMVIDDVIVFFPGQINDALASYARANAVDWLAELERPRRLERQLPEMRQGIRGLERQLKGLDSQIRSVEGAVRGLAEKRERSEGASWQLSEAPGQIRALAQQVTALSGQVQAVQSATGSVTKRGESHRKQLSEARGQIRALAQQLTALSGQIQAVQSATGSVTKRGESHRRQLSEARQDIRGLRKQLEAVGEQVGGVDSRQEDLATQLGDLGERLEGLEEHGRGLEAVQRELQMLRRPQIVRLRRRRAVARALRRPVASMRRGRARGIRRARGARRQMTGSFRRRREHVLSRARTTRRRTLALPRLARRRARLTRRRARLMMGPRLGRLEHYAPKPLEIPDRYRRTAGPENPPVISIVTPSYNHAEFLERTIISVLDQRYPALEYIIQDGGSTDGTKEVLDRYRTRLHRYEIRPDNGQAHAINLGLAHATGEILAYLNSDDLLLPGALSYVARYFERHPSVDVVYGHRVLVDENDMEVGRWVLPGHDDEVLSWADFVPQETLFWRRGAWQAAGGIVDQQFQFALDWDLLLRFRRAGARMVRLPRFLGAFRVHASQKSSAQADTIGGDEMDQLRAREHGREVSREEIYRELRGYMRRHILLDRLYGLGLVRY